MLAVHSVYYLIAASPCFSISMTVAEHILFYSLLKGRPIAEAEEEVENMLQDLGLPHKRDELTQNLSGLSGRFFTQKKLQYGYVLFLCLFVF